MINETSHLRKHKSMSDPDTQTKRGLSYTGTLADIQQHPKFP